MSDDDHPIAALFASVTLHGLVFLAVVPVAVVFPALILYSPLAAVGLVLVGVMGQAACLAVETMLPGRRRTKPARRTAREGSGR